MLKDIATQLKLSLIFTLLFTVVTGLAYPLAVTGVIRTLFPRQAAGSLILRDGKAVGSELIGQPFDDPKYFWSRPSATGPYPYNAANSSGSNLGPLNPALADAVKGRVTALRHADPGNTAAVPMDLVTASASGIDPHISPEAAAYQVARVARVRHVAVAVVASLVANHTERPLGGVLGNPRVNVLKLNLDLDRISIRAR